MAKYAGEKWKSLTDQQKLPYQKLADDDRARYDADVAAAPKDSNGQAKKVNKKRKDIKAQSAYAIFSSQESQRLRSEDSTLSFGDMSKKIGETWKSMSDTDKEPFKQQSIQQQQQIDSGETPVKERAQKKKKQRHESDSSDDENRQVEVAAGMYC